MNNSMMSGLPEELIMEILLRLPTRSIGRFRCVSKCFCSLSFDLKFAKNHLELAIQKNAVHRKFIYPSWNLNLYSVDIDSIGDGCEGIRDLAAVELDYPLKDEPPEPVYLQLRRPWRFGSTWNGRTHVKVVGSSNGLVCIYSNKSAFLYNPTTREYKRIPEPKLANVNKYYGFGFDTLNDDYKVVKFVGSDECYPNADVYSLKTDSWRRIRGLLFKHIDETSGVLLNGVIHWVVKLHKGQNNKKKRVVVAAFDLKTDEFRYSPLPDDEAAQAWYDLTVVTLKGQLCLVYSGGYEKHAVIWVLNEYGNERSWSKIQLSMSYNSYNSLICSTKNDEEVLFELDENLVLYNFEKNTSRDLKIRGFDFRCSFNAKIYVESLISPNSYHNGIGKIEEDA